jgi:hypothetical protein
MTDLAIVFGSVFMLICIAIFLLHSSYIGRVTLLDWSVLGIGGIYGGGWALVAYVTRAGGNSFWEKWLLPSDHLYPLHTLCSIILVGVIYLGWLFAGPLRIKSHKRSKAPLMQNDYRLYRAGWMLLILALVMQWLYTYAYGGYIGALDYSASIRSAIFTVNNPLSFLRPFGGLAFFSSFLFFGLWLGGCNRRGIKIGFVLAFVFSIYILFSWLGRIGFLVFLATFVLGVLLAKRVRPLSLLAGGCLIMLLILIGAYQVSVWFNFKEANNVFLFMARELSFPFASFFAQLDAGEHLFRAFKDLLVAPVYLLPSSLWSNWVENVSQVNTALIMGAPKGEAGVTGGIPVDLITLGLMQASGAGIAVVGFLFGVGLRLIQFFVDSIRNPGVRAVFESYIALKISVLAIFYAQPSLVVSSNIALIAAIFIIVLNTRMPRIRLFRRLGHVDSMGARIHQG